MAGLQAAAILRGRGFAAGASRRPASCAVARPVPPRRAVAAAQRRARVGGAIFSHVPRAVVEAPGRAADEGEEEEDDELQFRWNAVVKIHTTSQSPDWSMPWQASSSS